MATIAQQLKKWEVKDRTYYLKGNRAPLTYKIRSSGLLWFDEVKNVNREIRYATNQNSLFTDQQDDNVRVGHIVFEDGVLFVPRSNPQLQKLLSIYHPELNQLYAEWDDNQVAEDEVDSIEYGLTALNLVQELDIEHIEAILRTELGSGVTSMTSKELKRDAYRFAKNNPKLFIEISQDEDIKLRNLANRAVESGIIKLTDDNTTFKYPNGKKIMTVPFDQHPYGALAAYFKTDNGIDLMKSITNKLS